ncbi:class I SAM-dependent methyltransferase [Flavobacterium oreochromis]|uniref:SAM-dependent methyltransferase n=1 Tax=Flavobacterium columnare TaxID=996 RepID=A0A246GAY3_9FLAO|nr:SAM-dependent methyltransferase [Flavobacterium oreochromis]OWP77432.1 SAM-dependent methyltransferase [Flavobacterium oreochromis]QYS85940.1 class I SAM-dependent methyltransferase [Flavobacterium oreochromis]
MNFDLLAPKVQEFIENSLTLNFTKVALMKNPFPEIPWNEILNQIASKTKAKEKLPTWYHQKNIIFPSKLSVEQTSSEITARYKSTLINGKTLIDLTGGFGVDDYYFSKNFNQLIHCEIKSELHEITKHNFKNLKANNIECYLGDSHEILKNFNQVFDWIYIDPSRRNDTKGKVFLLKDCLPNVPDFLDFYFQFTEHILIKTAPILDISAGLNELRNVKEIHIVALQNEVKEILWIIEKNYKQDILIKAVNITKEEKEVIEFLWGKESFDCKHSIVQDFLYEPNSAIMKSGAFDYICHLFPVYKLHSFSHLYTNSELINFPGRKFRVLQNIPYNKIEIKKHLEGKKANITTRNFPETVEIIRKKWKIKEGGDLYTFFTTDLDNNKIILLCEKI